MFKKRLIHEYPSNFIHNNQKLKTTQNYINKKVGKQILVDS